jgi:NADH-quinone oxidoreductase subunit A
MLGEYFPILLFSAIGILVGLVPIGLCYILSPKKPNTGKLSAYECGFTEFSDSRVKFDVRYYLIAILFIVFDIEVAFLFPWAVIVRELSLAAIFAMVIFLLLLTIGFIYEWGKGALEWE